MIRKHPALFLSAAEAFLILLFCTKSSFLYPFNNWTDANCFFTVGKAILNGQVLYRDIIEQKGLLLYVLHALASLVSSGTFTGVFLLEVICGTFTIYLFHRILKSSCGNLSFILAPLAAALLFTSDVFRHGDSTEELCTPMLLYTAFVTMKSVEDDAPVSYRQWTVIGILAGCTFWIKYSMCPFFAGAVILPFVMDIRRKEARIIPREILQALAGFAAVSVPVLLYFIINGALKDMYDVYFYDNLFRYSAGILSGSRAGGPPSSGKAAPGILLSWFRKAPYHMALIMIAFLLSALRKKWFRLLQLFLMFAASVPALLAGRRYPYYYFILGFLLIFGMEEIGVLILSLVRILKKNQARAVRPVFLFTGVILSVVLSTGIACCCSPNRSFRSEQKEDLPQFKFAEIINTVPDATLLNYGFLDYGFYTAAGILPSCRFFCSLNGSIPGMSQEMDSYLKNKEVDFVVTRGQRLKAAGYTQVAAAQDTYEGIRFTYNLYEKSSLIKQ
jgi:hypothetical protein